MATHRSARPIGTILAEPLQRGTLDRCDPAWPGSVGYPGIVPAGPVRGLAAGPACLDAPSAWISFDAGALPIGEQVNARSPIAIRFADRSEDDAGYRQLRLPTLEAAKVVAARVAAHPAADSLLRELAARTGEARTAWLARQLFAGDLKIEWRLREPPSRPQAAAPARTPPPRPVARSVSAPTPVDSTFPPGLDAAVVAESLISAAAEGVPFCEECMKAQQESAGAGAT